MAGVRKKRQSGGKYQGWFVDSNGKRKFFTGVHNRAETLSMAQRLEDDHKQVRLGYRPAPKSYDKQRCRPFVEVTAEYCSWGESQGGRGGRSWSEDHARKRRTGLDWWQKQLGVDTLADLDDILSRVEAALRRLQEDGRSGKTLQNYAGVLKGFCRWCVKRGYLSEDPLKDMVGFDTTVQNVRRAMTPEEIVRLLRAAPEYRRLVYEVAFSTGLRANELRSLQIDDLDVKRHGLHLDASWTKNRKPGFQPLPATLVDRLAAFAESGKAGELYRRYRGRRDSKKDIAGSPLMYVPTQPARMMETDIEVAGIQKLAPGGKIDFHACRVAYVNLVIEAGANVREAQALARHSTPNMTMNVYGRTRQDRLVELTEKVSQAISVADDEADAACAICVQKKAAGAESISPNAFTGNTLAMVKSDVTSGFNSPRLHQSPAS